MNEQWNTIKRLVADALELPADQREAFIREACSGDEPLLSDVRSLLQASTDSETRFETPGIDLPAAGVVSLSEDLSLPEPAAWLEPGTRVGPYEIESVLGEGGFAEVYSALQREPVERSVALKRLKPGMDSRAILQRFDAERRTLARLAHPHIARVLDAGVDDDGRPWVAMDLVRGEPIITHVRRGEASLGRRIELFLQVCDAVEHAHRRGVLHRDLKPLNVLVDDERGAQVIDFGIARLLDPDGDSPVLTADGAFLGTPAYASPEQLAGDRGDLDTRTDVYALGVLLYELLTGSRPLDDPGRSAPAALADRLRRLESAAVERPSQRVAASAGGRKISVEPVSSRALRGELDWITLRALECERERRYSSVSALAEDLRRALRGEPVDAGPPGAAYRLRRFAGRHRALVAAGLVASLAIVGGGVAATVGFVRASDARVEAEREAAAARAARAESDEVGGFLADLFIAPRPGELGRDATMLEFLDSAREQLDARSDDDEPITAVRITSRLCRILGASYVRLGELDIADEQLTRAERLAHERLGVDDPTRLEAVYQLAQLRVRQSRIDDAVALTDEYERRALAVFGEDANDRRRVAEVRAQGLFEAGDRTAARKAYETLLAIDEASGDIPVTVTTLSNLAQTCYTLGDTDAALRYAERAWSLGRDSLGAQHPRSILAGRDLGLTLLASDRKRAIQVLGAAAEASAERFGPAHFQTLGIENYLAFAYQTSGEPERATALYADLIPRQEETLGPLARQTMMALHNLGMLVLGKDDEAAVRHLTTALERFAEARGPEHPETIVCEVHLYEARSATEGPRAVAAAYAAAMLRLDAAYPEGHPQRVDAHGDYAKFLERLAAAPGR